MKTIRLKNWLTRFLVVSMFILGIGTCAVLSAADTTGSAATTVTTTPWYASSALWSAVIALIAGAFGIWQNKAKRTADKVNETLVIAFEEASKIPAVAEKEKEMKAKIKEITTKAGVEPIVNKLVNLLT